MINCNTCKVAFMWICITILWHASERNIEGFSRFSFTLHHISAEGGAATHLRLRHTQGCCVLIKILNSADICFRGEIQNISNTMTVPLAFLSFQVKMNKDLKRRKKDKHFVGNGENLFSWSWQVTRTTKNCDKLILHEIKYSSDILIMKNFNMCNLHKQVWVCENICPVPVLVLCFFVADQTTFHPVGINYVIIHANLHTDLVMNIHTDDNIIWW